MSFNFYQSQVARTPKGVPGQLATTNLGRTDEEALETSGLIKQSGTIVVDTATNSGVYGVLDQLSGEEVIVTADASATVGEVATLLYNAILANYVLLGRADFVLAADTITYTCRSTGDAEQVVDFVATQARAADLTITDVPASESAGIAFGVPVYLDADGKATETRPGSGDFADVCRGISIIDLTMEKERGANAALARPGWFCRVLRTGSIYVADGDTATRGQAVYIGTASGEVNKFYNATGTGRQLIPRTFMEWNGPNIIEIKAGR